MHKLWQTLLEAKLVSGEMPIKQEAHSPWYVSLLLAFSGWLAALFLLGFLFAGFETIFNNDVALFIIGAVMIGIAYAILKKEKNNFIEHLGLAISFAGQALIVIGFFKILGSHTQVIWFGLFLLQSLLVQVMPNYLHRLFSAFFMAISFALLLTSLSIPQTVPFLMMAGIAYLWLHEFSSPKKVKKRQALGYAFVLALMLIESTGLLKKSVSQWSLHTDVSSLSLWFPPYLGPLLEGVVVLYVLITLLKQHDIDHKSKVGLIAIISIGLFTMLGLVMPGFMLGILIVLLGFNHSNRLLMGLGIFSLLYAASSYYYLLEITLWDKALYLGLLGVVLLLGRVLVFQLIVPATKTRKGSNV